jgi:hypothetical protein
LRSFDLGGQILAIASLTGLIGAVIEVRPLGVTHPDCRLGGCRRWPQPPQRLHSGFQEQETAAPERVIFAG